MGGVVNWHRNALLPDVSSDCRADTESTHRPDGLRGRMHPVERGFQHAFRGWIGQLRVHELGHPSPLFHERDRCLQDLASDAVRPAAEPRMGASGRIRSSRADSFRF